MRKYEHLKILLVTADTTDDMIEEYIDFHRHLACQLTLKELVGFDDKGRYKEVKKNFPDVFCLYAGDYNLYYMPDNTVRTSFLGDSVS